MKNRDVTRIVKDALSDYFKDQEFKWIAKESCMASKTKTSENKIYVGIVNSFPEYTLSLSFTQRYPSIEAVFHRFSGAPPEYQSRSHTINLPMSHFSNDKTTKFKVATEDEARQAIAQILGSHGQAIKTFFAEITTEGQLETIINSKYDPFDQPSRAMHGLILSKQYSPERFDTIRQMYLNHLPVLSDIEQARLNNLIAHLESLNEINHTA